MFRLTFHPYQRRFKRLLRTHHGVWSVREGIIVQLQDGQGRTGQGEIAPLPWFGSETLEEALYFCRHLPQRFSLDELESIPATLPACQFGLGSALEQLRRDGQRLEEHSFPLAYSALLPSGESALTAWSPLWEQGYRTFKVKIGVHDLAAEQELCQTLRQQLPSSAQLRLDANGGLDLQMAQTWLEVCDGRLRNSSSGGRPAGDHRINIEYLEQPLPVQQFESVLALSQQYDTPIALDESVATLSELVACYQRGWRGIFVIKPAISGYPQKLREFCQTHAIDAVFSSVFETDVGRQTCLQMAQTLSTRAVGFGIDHWFAA